MYKSGWSSKSVCEKSSYINVTSYYKRKKKKLVQKKKKNKNFSIGIIIIIILDYDKPIYITYTG